MSYPPQPQAPPPAVNGQPVGTTYTGPQQGALPASVKPGDARTLGYGTDQGRWLSASLQGSSGAANPFRQQRQY